MAGVNIARQTQDVMPRIASAVKTAHRKKRIRQRIMPDPQQTAFRHCQSHQLRHFPSWLRWEFLAHIPVRPYSRTGDMYPQT